MAVNQNVCALGPKTQDLPKVRDEIAAARKKRDDKVYYRETLLKQPLAWRKQWLKKQEDQQYWLDIAAEVRNEAR